MNISRQVPELKKEEIDRFWNRVALTANSDKCWDWTGRKFPSGYGEFHFNSSHFGSHRVAFLLGNNGINMVNLYVCHKCDNKACCNPKHLFLGTPADNSKDMKEKGRAVSGSKINPSCMQRGQDHVCAKLKNDDVYKIRDLYKNGTHTYKELSKMFGVDKPQIGRIIRRQTWKHI